MLCVYSVDLILLSSCSQLTLKTVFGVAGVPLLLITHTQYCLLTLNTVFGVADVSSCSQLTLNTVYNGSLYGMKGCEEVVYKNQLSYNGKTNLSLLMVIAQLEEVFPLRHTSKINSLSIISMGG